MLDKTLSKHQRKIIIITMVSVLTTSVLIFSLFFPIIIFFVVTKLKASFTTNDSDLRTSYPLLPSLFLLFKNRGRFTLWTSEIVLAAPTLTLSFHRDFAGRKIISADPAVVRHITKTHFDNYDKGRVFRSTLYDLLGDGIFNSNAEKWKLQRHIASSEFSTKSLRRFVETVVDSQISGRLIPIMATAAAGNAAVDFQDVLQRFAFDNICKISFGYDPRSLSPALPSVEFAAAFDAAVNISGKRFLELFPLVWRIKKALDVGSEKKLNVAVGKVREFATNMVRKKKKKIERRLSLDQPNMDKDNDLLSRFLVSGYTDENFATDIVISFILAGRDTTSAALTWFFWLLSNHPGVEAEIMKELKKWKPKTAASAYDEAKEMVYTHASLCEAMRLYPPVPFDSKEALNDDVLPDGTVVKKGMRVGYLPYAMGRAERVWGKDWAEFRPERWLDWDAAADKWAFVGRDAYAYPVFQAGPRICLGKDMAFIQMKGVVAAVLRRFRVVPVGGATPVYVANLTAKMEGGFPVRIEARSEESS
ncbi:cytochrome P450 94A2-like [Andrographis paniculata]|uniref:cytochrome P450 94A2-like n=1 Tax=Andrographis paniculata TaxID=175694 RepID=UPI0021E6EE9A|nr:cytochrome P450 94A2-like [Andrographis paniculata]